MSRSTWKPTFVDNKLWNISRHFGGKQESAITESDLVCTKRSTPVLPFRVGKRIHVTNGIRLVPLAINAEIVGHRIGEFVATRKRIIPPSSKTSKVPGKGLKK